MPFSFNDDRIRALLSGRRAVRRIQFPGLESDPDAVVGIRLLSGNESDAARGEATQRVNEETGRLTLDAQARMIYDPGVVDIQIMRNIVRLAVVQAEPDEKGHHKPFFPGAAAVDEMPAHLVHRFYEAYKALEEYVDPEPMSEEQRVTILDELKKTQDLEVLWLGCEPNMRLRLLLILHAEWMRLLTGKSSTGDSAPASS